MEPKRLYRSQTDRKFAGVAGGLAEYFLIDPLLIRLIFVVLTFAGGGGVALYIILWIITPEQPYRIPNNLGYTQPDPPRPDQTRPDQPQEPDQEPQPGRTYYDSKPFTQPDAMPPVRKHRGSLIGGLVLITLGALFLADELIPSVNFSDLWPVVLIVVGLGLLIKAISNKNTTNSF